MILTWHKLSEYFSLFLMWLSRYFTFNTFAASYLNIQGLNNSYSKSPASTLVDLIFNRARSALSA